MRAAGRAWLLTIQRLAGRLAAAIDVVGVGQELVLDQLARHLDLGAGLAALVVAMGDHAELTGGLAVAEEDHAGRLDHAIDRARDRDLLAFEVVAELRRRRARLKPQGR